jgi:hypothetical protein
LLGGRIVGRYGRGRGRGFIHEFHAKAGLQKARRAGKTMSYRKSS